MKAVHLPSQWRASHLLEKNLTDNLPTSRRQLHLTTYQLLVMQRHCVGWREQRCSLFTSHVPTVQNILASLFMWASHITHCVVVGLNLSFTVELLLFYWSLWWVSLQDLVVFLNFSFKLRPPTDELARSGSWGAHRFKPRFGGPPGNLIYYE